MTLHYPDIFLQFRCICGDCRDNCCRTGWDIEVDRRTFEFYSGLRDPLAVRFVDSVYEEEGCLYMKHEGGCPFMNGKGLCGLQLLYGEGHISEICREHPRFYEWFGDYKEAGVGLSCEEAARLLMGHERPIVFSERQTDEETDSLEFDSKLFEGVKMIRERLIDILQDRGFTVLQRLGMVVFSAEDIQQAVFDEDVKRLKQISGMLAIDGFRIEMMNEAGDHYYIHEDQGLGRMAEIMGKMEYLDGGFGELFSLTREDIERIAECEGRFDREYGGSSYELENLAVYFIYRYLIKAVRDYAVKERLFMAVFCTLAVRLLFLREYAENGALPDKERRCFLVKEFSKEIEYDADNMDIIYGEIQDGGLNSDILCGLIFGEG
ncbi:MAG: flagellin lysine-N-methylase [Ruminococcus sp.]|nr:flagellin lysine-N-methylase [Ruminococcus sp.]